MMGSGVRLPPSALDRASNMAISGDPGKYRPGAPGVTKSIRAAQIGSQLVHSGGRGRHRSRLPRTRERWTGAGSNRPLRPRPQRARPSMRRSPLRGRATSPANRQIGSQIGSQASSTTRRRQLVRPHGRDRRGHVGDHALLFLVGGTAGVLIALTGYYRGRLNRCQAAAAYRTCRSWK